MTHAMKKRVLAVVLAIFLRFVVTGAVTTLSVAVKFIETYKMKRPKQSNLFEGIKNKMGDCNMRKSSRILSGLVLGVIFLASIPIVVNAGAIFNPHAEVKIVGFPSETIANGDNFLTIVLTNKDVLTGIDSADEKGAKVILELAGGIFKSVELLSADGCDNCFDKYGGKGTSKLTIGKSFLAKGSSAVAIVRYSATKESGDITLTATGEIKGPDGYIDSDTATISGTIVTPDYPIFSIKTLIETADRRGKFYNQSAELLETVLFSEKTLNENMQNAWTNSMFWIMGLGARMFMMPVQEPSTSAKALLKGGVESYLDVDGRITDYSLESTFSSIDRIIDKIGNNVIYKPRINLLTKALNEMKAATDYEIKCWEDLETHRSYLKLMFKYSKSSSMKYNEYDTIFDIHVEAHQLVIDAEQNVKTKGRDVDFFVMTMAKSIEAFAINDLEYIKKCEQLLNDIDNLEDDASKPEFTPLDLCMVLDRSGSMKDPMNGKTKMQGVKEAATGVVNVLLPQDRVSIIPFSDTATANIDLTSDFSRVKTKINAITAEGKTSFGAGLEAALDQFKDYGNTDNNPAILFMSDGEHNKAPNPEAYVTQCMDKGIPIFTVGFATSESEVDVTKLKMMAEETGGEYHFVSKNFNLQNIFLGLQHKASGWESVAAYVGEVDEGETVTAGTFYVDPAIDDLRVTLNWPGSNLDLELFDPSNRQADFGASNVIYSGDTKPEYVIIKDPQSGTWTTKVYGKSIGSSEEFYVLVTKYVPPKPTGKEWNRTFGGTGWDVAYSVQQTSDGGYILAGNTESFGAGSRDFWLVKTDSNGNKQWDKTFGGTDSDSAYSVQQTSDGGYILAGSTGSFGAGSLDFWLVKTDSNGNKQWDKTFGGIDRDYACSAQQTIDGGYMLAGSTSSYGAGHDAVWLVKTDSDGNKQWDRTFGGIGWDYANSAQQTSDGGYIIAGTTYSYGAGAGDFWLVKTDSNGNMQWDKTFGGTSGDSAYSVQQTIDGGYIIAGTTYSYGADAGDFWLVKTDSSGNKQWDKTFGGIDQDEACSVQQTPDGSYILAGSTKSYGAGGKDVWLVKTDSDGNKQWDRIFGGSSWDDANSLQMASDGDIVLAGFTGSYGAGSYDFWLIKVKEEEVEISGGNVIFQDNFDSYSAGTFPSSGGWQLTYNGYGDSYQVVDNSQHVSATNTLKLEGRANWAASADHPLAETPDQVIYEVDVKVTQPGSSVMNYHDAAMGLENPNIGTWGTRYAGVIFGNAENRVIQPGNIPFNFDQWYHIKVEADMNTGVYDVWLDDQLIASDISTSSKGDYTDIRLEGGNNAHTRVWFDNVKVLSW